MPRQPKPHVSKGWFRTNVGGIQGHPLCRVEEGKTKAERLLRVRLGQLAEAQATGNATRPVGSGIQARPTRDPEQGKLAGQVHDEFLDFVKVERPDSYVHYLDKLKPFVQRFGHRRLASLTENDGIVFKQWVLTEKPWVKGGKTPGQKSTAMKGFGPTPCNHFLRAARGLVNWAAKPKRGYISANPWQDIKLPTEKPRERLITDDEFQHLLAQAGDDDFRDTLLLMRHSTARPGEVRMAAWEMVDWGYHRLDFNRLKVKTRRPRTPTLLPEVEAMRRRLDRVRQQGGDTEGLIFRNADGGPWAVLRQARRGRGGHGGRHGRRGHEVELVPDQAGRHRCRPDGLAGARPVRWEWGPEDRPLRAPDLLRAGRARDAGDDRLHGTAQHRPRRATTTCTPP